MKDKKKIFVALLLLACVLSGYFLWWSLRAVEIVAVHEEGNFSDVLVRNFPLTDKGKIHWWLKNKEMLRNKYKIPQPAPYGNFTITFWLFGDGYKEEGKYDRLCFNDMKKTERCIEKDAVFSVNKSKDMGVVFTVYDGKYLISDNGEIVKIKYE